MVTERRAHQRYVIDGLMVELAGVDRAAAQALHSSQPTLSRELALMEQRLGCPIRTYFEQQGEEAFRDLEQAVIAELAVAQPVVGDKTAEV